MATIAIPLTAGTGTSGSSDIAAEAVEPATAPVGPSTLSIVGAAGAEEAPPASLAQAVSAEERTVLAASRSEERSPLPGCDSSAVSQGTNGNLSKDSLCELWGSGTYVRADAAVALAALNESYVQTFGVNMGITDGYRTLSSQYSLKSTKGAIAATPGKSEHGWGLAVDLRPETYQSAVKTKWLRTNAPLFGWDNPAWARPGGSGATEPWHWEFTEGVEAHG
ncbi:D-alanyl-D-alanine carboxypeptidase [Sanguibacter gelidistatuariae]|uniref:D-alanyl-D-alanine carboxypeptidase n=1 Tax=Sanguibacter gelidistatuariae TaxID=1814289 RepID=A0A1G6VPP9_9MICO|nr:D-alanyl-D-alanine carboxypeptidase [Sanguibacter gelidistatuariae]